MCGIAAFSLSENSKQNARELAHALLTQIENRGSHASGFAYITDAGKVGIYKNPKPGSQLPLAELPRNAKTVILHTRYATQGSPQNNRNNHPVVSTDKKIALVHNGVISNDYSLRDELGITAAHGEVDSLVIPSLIAQQGVEGLSKLSGYAAIAWIDTSEDALLHIAKLKQSPVAYTQTFDGSFVMASTPLLLVDALDSINANYGGVFDLAEGRQITVTNGFILEHEKAPSMTYNYRAYQRHSNATSGGHGSEDKPRTTVYGNGYQPPIKRDLTPPVTVMGPTGVNASKVGPVGSEVTKSDDAVMADLDAWRKRREQQDAEAQARSLARGDGETMALGMAEELSDDEWEEYVEQAMKDQQDADKGDLNVDDSAEGESCSTVTSRYLAGEGFYIIDNEGDISHYPTLDDLEARLTWVSKMSKSEYDIFTVPDEMNWVNHILDMGSVDEKGELVSWIDDMSDIDEYESPAVKNLQYIREGVGQMLTTLKGR